LLCISQAMRIFILHSTSYKNICFIFYITWEYLFYIPQAIRIFYIPQAIRIIVLYSTYRENICFIFHKSLEYFYAPQVIRIFVLYSTFRENICFIFHKPLEYFYIPQNIRIFVFVFYKYYRMISKVTKMALGSTCNQNGHNRNCQKTDWMGTMSIKSSRKTKTEMARIGRRRFKGDEKWEIGERSVKIEDCGTKS